MLPVKITYRSMQESLTVDYHIVKHYQKIKRIYPKIANCRAVISLAHKHKSKGKIFSLSIEINCLGKIFVSHKQNQNIYLVIRDGFNAIEKLLEKHHRLKRKSFITDKFLKNRMIDDRAYLYASSPQEL